MTILSESTARMLDQSWTTALILVIIAFLFVTVLLLLFYYKCYKISYALVIIIIALIIIIVVFHTRLHKKIKATISDDYPAVMLYDKYDVIDRDGKIWTLQEKEPMVEEYD